MPELLVAQPQSRSTLHRRCLEFVSLALSSAALILMPKCPACLAVYVAVLTGLALPLSMARSVWYLLSSLCGLSVATVVFRLLSRQTHRQDQR